MITKLLTLLPLTLASTAFAQVSYDPFVGPPLGAGDDTITAALPLGFSFAFPGGVLATSIDIDSNGRVLPAGGNVSDPFAWGPGLLAGPTSICPFWFDLDFSDPTAGDVHFNTAPGRATITFQNAILLGLPGLPFTFQVQLFADGRIGFVYDARTGPEFSLVGVSPGAGAIDPGLTDLSQAVLAPIASGGVATIYEEFALSFGCDLASTALEFVPDGAGGYTVSARLADLASVAAFGKSCTSALRFTPDGLGGYTVVRCGPGCYDPVPGISLGITGDDEISGPHALGFGFTMPGGVVATALDVDSNGRLLLPAADGSDFSPTPLELRTDPTPTIAPLWSDWDIGASPGADIRVRTGAGFATFTWYRIAQFGGTTPSTFQVTLRSDDSITMSWFDTTAWDGMGGMADALVGVSAGSNAPDPGQQDFAMLPFAGGATVYEFFEGAFERLDLQLSTVPLSAPILGSSFQVRLEGLSATTLSANVFVGFSNPNLDLDFVPLGLESCWLLCNPALAAIPLAFGGSQSAVFGLPIPNLLPVAGLPLFLQAVNVAPGQTTLGVVFGNAVEAITGT